MSIEERIKNVAMNCAKQAKKFDRDRKANTPNEWMSERNAIAYNVALCVAQWAINTQKQIDIENACKWVHEHYDGYDGADFERDFRKAMEE